MIVPMIEPIACPPSAGAPSTRTTLRPSRAASSAAETPEIPAPSTQMSAATFLTARLAGRRTLRVAMPSDFSWLMVSIALYQHGAGRHRLHAALIDGKIACRLRQAGHAAPCAPRLELRRGHLELEAVPVHVDRD